jgi:hypothetical protein
MTKEKIKWTAMSPLEAVHPGGPLDKSTGAIPVKIETLPAGIQNGMPGLLSACSNVTGPFVVGSVTITGALGVARVEGATTKGYPYALAENQIGDKLFAACDRHFDGHHCTFGKPDETNLLEQVKPENVLKKG